MASEDLPRRDRSVKQSRPLMSVETQGSLLVLFGFFAGFAAIVMREKPGLNFIGNAVAVLSIGMVVVGCVMSIAGKKR